MGSLKRKVDDAIDLVSSDSDRIIVRSARTKRQRRLPALKVIDLTSDVENDPQSIKSATQNATKRELFRELSAAEYQRRLNGPTAWVQLTHTSKLPPHARRPLQRQASSATPHQDSLTRGRESRPIDTCIAKTAPAHRSQVSLATAAIRSPFAGRSQRQAMPQSKTVSKMQRNAFSIMMGKSSSDSEDELHDASRPRRAVSSIRKTTAKKPPRAKADDSDLMAESSSDEGDWDQADSSPSATESESYSSGKEGANFRTRKSNYAGSNATQRPKSSSKKHQPKPERNAKPKGRLQQGSNMVNLLKPENGQGKGLLHSYPPLSDTREIFQDILEKALTKGLSEAIDALPGTLRVATMCSGTESPLLALHMFQECLNNSKLQFEHLFSAEIVPFKQAYIERNFRPPIIFRDITELTEAMNDAEPVATTAYGSRVPVPGDVDMLIAGTSCVDFSKLNKHRKKMDEGGESGDTYGAVLAYCRASRPSIVLLENVRDAPWDTMLSDYRNIGYETAGVLVDTKLHYLPQTRQRGYMVCFDKHGGTALDGAGKQWSSLMGYFRRPASSPVSSFLLRSNEVNSRRQIKEDEGPARDFDWTRCELRHMKLRHHLRLGSERPVTQWSESGSLTVPEGGDPAWYSRVVERVWDFLDLAVLRKALPSQGFYDARYKTRIWDVSQNVDREKDTTAFGIIGCISPSMMPFISDAGRVLCPEELLRLQGLPLDRISFTTETAANIKDLAGNAMSTTVVGPAILAAVIAGHRSIRRHDRKTKVPHARGSSSANAMVTGHTETVQHTVKQSVDLKALFQKAGQAARRCVCESSGKLAVKPMQQCTCCGHTACLACAGNPEHSYRSEPTLSSNRLAPQQFEDYIRRTLPLSLTLSLHAFWRDCEPESWYQEIIETIGKQFHFQSVRQSHCWTISYVGQAARLDLVLSEHRNEWQLFANIPQHLPCDSAYRADLKSPIARGEVTSNFYGDSWEFRLPGHRDAPIVIKEQGGKKASWWARNGMPDFVPASNSIGHTVPELLSISVYDDQLSCLDGMYQYLPHCGKACDSLFKRSEQYTGSRPMYLFLDPASLGKPGQDTFVFSQNIERLEHDQTRSVIARIQAPWRPWDQPGVKRVKPRLLVESSWHASRKFQLTPTNADLNITRPKAADAILENATCAQTVLLLRANLPNSSHDFEGVDATKDASFLSRYHWIGEGMGRCFPSESWRSLSESAHSLRCLTCAPSRPKLRWALQEGGEVKPYEDVPTAAEYEEAMKARPAAMTLTATQKNGVLQLDFGVNLATLAHRAAARLPKMVSDFSFSWRLRNRADRTPFLFKKFQLESNKDIEPWNGKTNLSVELFAQQKQSLAWMLEQERGVRFILEEIEEELLPDVDWLAEARAQGSVTIRGGICADHPGFGKTITSLALINGQTESSDEIIAGLEQSSGLELCATAATLIICPASLVQQWVDEISEKTGSTNGVISIQQSAHLSRHTLKSFRNAKIIVLNRDVLVHEAYTERLASFAAIPGPAATAGRAFTQWRANAVQQIRKHLPLLLKEGLSKLRSHIKDEYHQNMSSEEFQAAVPSRRHRGRNYVENKIKKHLSGPHKSKAAAPIAIDTTTVGEPLIEMFFYNRLIVDEFHDYEPKVYAAVSALEADKRWGLSGTPAIEDFYQVSNMARLLGVTLPIGSMDNAVMKSSSRQALQKDLSSFELFDNMWRQLPTPSRYRSIHALHQRFLSVFARQNVGDFGKTAYCDHLVPVSLGVEHQLLYMELSQHLNTAHMRIRKSNKSKATDRNDRLNDAVASSDTAEEALSKAAAYMNQELKGKSSLLDDLIESCGRNIQMLHNAISETASQAAAREADQYHEWKNYTMKDGGIPDQIISEEISKLLAPASKTKGHRADENNVVIDKLSKLCSRLVVERRSMRYLSGARQLQRLAQQDEKANVCDNPACNIPKPQRYALSAVCGHLVCESCYENCKNHAVSRCLATECCNTVQAHHLLWTDKMGDLKRKSPPPYGAKLEKAVELLREIQKKGEQAILFVQFDQQMHQVESALRDSGISGIVVHSAHSAGRQLSAFRDSEGTREQKTVIVLNAAAETAAGSNLQNANHVIFLSPLLQRTQYKYDATMAQAIGRVRRFGQKRPIHVYRIVALDTIDVDVLEHRERRADALVEQGQSRIVPPQAVEELDMRVEIKLERTQLVRENGKFSLRPRSWLIRCGADMDTDEVDKVRGKDRILGWEDFSSLVKFSTKYTEDDDE